MRRVRVSHSAQDMYSECEWRHAEQTVVDRFSFDEVEFVLQECMDRLGTRLHLMIQRWLIPATVFTEQLLFRFVLETMLTEDLCIPGTEFKVFISDDIFKLVSEYTGQDMFEMKVGSEEYQERFSLLMRLISPVKQLLFDYLKTAALAFVHRAVDLATPPEVGLVDKTNLNLLPIMFGSYEFGATGLGSKRWEVNYLETDEPYPVATGLLRLVIMRCRRNRTALLENTSSATLVGTEAASILTEQLAERFTEFSMFWGSLEVRGVSMRKNGDLVRLLASLFDCDEEFAREGLLAKKSLAPESLSGLVNVPFVVENILFAIHTNQLHIPRTISKRHNLDRAKFLVSTRACIRKALALAFESTDGVSLEKLQAFSRFCGSSSRNFIHLSRCFHVIAQGVMSKHEYARKELLELELSKESLLQAEIMVDEEIEFTKGPWKDVIVYKDDDTFFCVANLLERLATIAHSGAVTRTPWVGKQILFLPQKNRRDLLHVATQTDPGEAGLWRIMNTLFKVKELNALVPTTKPQLYRNTDVLPEILDVVYGKATPTFSEVLNSVCQGKEKMTLAILPVFVLLWNASMVIRKRIHERATHLEPPVRAGGSKKRARAATKISCLVCLEERTEAVNTVCEHDICNECASVMLETRIVDAFAGKHGVHSTEEITNCPVAGCHGSIHSNFIPSLVPEEVYAMYSSLSIRCASKSSDLPCCSVCGEAAPKSYQFKRDGAVYSCGVCGVENCSQCERVAHPGSPCMKREKGKKTPEDLLSASKIQHCPTCKTPEVKRRNCNHVLCKICKTDWCWSCAQVLDARDVTAHYREASPSCVSYSEETETARMRGALEKMRSTEDPLVVDCALQLLDDCLRQTDADI